MEEWWSRRYLQCKYITIITKDDALNDNELKQWRLIQRIRSIVRKKKEIDKEEKGE